MIAPKVQLPGGSGGGSETLQEAYEAGNTITTDGTNGSVIIDNSTGGQQLQIKGSSSQQVFEITDTVAAAGRVYGYTDGSMDFFPDDNAQYGVYIAPQNETAAHLRLEPLTAPPSSLSEGDIFLEGAAVDRLKVYVNATTNTVAWLSDITGDVWTRTGTDLAPTTSGDSVTMSGRFKIDKGADITAAGDLTLGSDGNFFKITGNTTINAITTTNWQAGSQVTLWFTGTPTISHNTAGGASTAKIQLEGAVNMSAEDGAYLTLTYNGTDWVEQTRRFP